jgi:hypothetical protein
MPLVDAGVVVGATNTDSKTSNTPVLPKLRVSKISSIDLLPTLGSFLACAQPYFASPMHCGPESSSCRQSVPCSKKKPETIANIWYVFNHGPQSGSYMNNVDVVGSAKARGGMTTADEIVLDSESPSPAHSTHRFMQRTGRAFDRDKLCSSPRRDTFLDYIC